MSAFWRRTPLPIARLDRKAGRLHMTTHALGPDPATGVWLRRRRQSEGGVVAVKLSRSATASYQRSSEIYPWPAK